MENINITKSLQNVLPLKTFLFNPSIAHLLDNIYIITVRSYIHDAKKPFDDNPKLLENIQHPWWTDWSGDDYTFILPVVLINNEIFPLVENNFPIKIPVQDMRIFRFMEDGDNIVFILTYNEKYYDSDIIIKGGDYCDDWCYLIGWSYLQINKNTLKYSLTPGKQPLCPNISTQIDKNWSLWKLKKK